ncbi:hypothetical protein NN561_006189 [Cricetulus griseus]
MALLSLIKQTQDEEKKQLTALRDLIKSSLQLDPREVGGLYAPSRANSDSQSRQGGYSMHQLQGNKEYGSEKKGYLLKKSDGIRKVWQRRKCAVKNGILTISHATLTQTLTVMAFSQRGSSKTLIHLSPVNNEDEWSDAVPRTQEKDEVTHIQGAAEQRCRATCVS